MASNYKNKKGASGKKYTTLGNQILVTYTDGSTRRVKPGDSTYEVTKRDMEKDIGAKKWYKPAGNSKTTAETAVGKGVTDGIVTSAKQNQLAAQAQAAAAQRKQAQAVRNVSTQPAQEQAKVLNHAINTMITKKAVDATKGITANSLKSGAEHGVQNLIAGTKQGLASGMSNLGRGGMAQAVPYAAFAEATGIMKPGTQANLMQQQKTGMEQLQRDIAAKSLAKSQAISQKYGELSKGEQFISDLVANLIPMGGAIAGGAIMAPTGLGAIGSMAPMYNYAKGLSVSQALNDGASYDQAQAYGIGKGAVETGTEMLFKGVKGLPGIVKAGDKVADAIKNPALKKAGAALTDVASEGAEEAIAEIIDPYLQKATYNEDAEIDWDNVVRSAVMGAVTSGAINATAFGAGKVKNIVENTLRNGKPAYNAPNSQQNQVQNAQTAQNSPEQAQTVSETEHIALPPKSAETEKYEAKITPQPAQKIQNAKTGNISPEFTLEMSERTFENVGDKKVKAYQQENPAVKPFYQRVADNLLADLQEGIKGGRDAGVNPETRTVTTMGGWQRQQSEPIERMLRDGMTYSQIEDGLQRIVEDHGKENTANAKRAELYVDDAVRKGYRSVVEGDVSADRAFTYRSMTAEQLQETMNRLENSFTGNPEQDAAIISEMETVQNLLDGMQQEPTVAENTTVEPTISEPETVQHFAEYTGQNVTPEVRTFLDGVSKKVGKDVVIVNSLPKGANGMFSGGKVYLDGNKLTSMDTVRRLTAHEVYHSMKNTPEFRKLQDVAMDFYRSINPELTNDILVQDKIREYADAGEQLDVDGAYDELTADFMEVALMEPEVAERIWASEPTLGQRIAEFIQNALQSFRNRKLSAMERQQKQLLTKAQKLYSKGLQSMKYQGSNELSIESDGSGQVQNPSGEVVAEQSEGENRFNLTTYESGGKKALEKYIRKMSTRGLMDAREGKEIVDYMDFVYDKVKELTTGENAGEYQYFTAWSEAKPMINEDGIPVLSVVTANGEYPMNLDFSQRCAKRVSMDNLLAYLTKNDMYDVSKLSPEDFSRINQILKENGFDIACSMCYVESKRDKSATWAKTIADEYNALLSAANIQNGVADRQALLAKAQELKKSSEKDDSESKGSIYDGYVKYILENPGKAKPVRAADLMYSEGISKLKADAPELYSIASRRFGAATPKPLTPEAVYNSEILSASLTGQMDDKLNPNRWTPEAAFEAGGVRLQSFSDYRANMFFDYCQLFADMAARKFPAQAYTKVESFVRLFGMTGTKINMSIIPEVKLSAADRAYVDSLSDSQKKKDARYLKLKETAGLNENGDYLWAAESFDYETAKELQNDDRYTDNVGTVAIGVSDAHIRKMLQDDDIRMIIPYHASGLNKDMARMKNIDLFTDYSSYQNDTYAKNEKMPNENWSDYYARITKSSKYGTKVKDNKLKFNFYDDLMETGDPVETSQNYVEACQNAGIVPKFPQFVYNPDGSFNENYYKLITDFTLYNKHGEACMQSVVKFDANHLPEDWRDILMADLKKSQAAQDKSTNEMAGVAEQVMAAIGNDTRYSLSQIGGNGGKSRYQELIDKYGSMKPGENPNGTNRDIPVPKQTSDWDKTRQWTRTAMEAEQVEDITVGMIADALTSDMQSGRFIYEPTSNREQVDRANRLINQTGWEQQKEQFRNKYRSGEAMTADDIALGERLIQEAQRAGDYETAVQLIADVAAIGTEAGRSVQALKILKRLTPEGQVAALKRIEQRINGSLTAQGKATVALPGDIAQQMLQARGADKQAEIWDDAIKELANQVPATFADKVNAWRYLAMLSNPKTHIRNMVGNAMMRTVMSVKNIVQTGLETAMSPLGIERTAAIRVPKEYREFAKWDYENNAKQMLAAGGGRYNDEIGLIAQNKRIFNNRYLEGARKFNSGMLDAEDMIFKKAAYIDAMSRYMYANGLSPSVMQNQASRTGATYEQGQNFAVEQAKKATFQEASKLAQKLAEIENMNNVSKIVMGALVPFKKTPINILKRGIEYSPVGVMNGVKKAVVDIRSGNATPAEAIDALTAGLTGTGIMMLGYFMASNGLLSGGADDDDQRKARYDSQMGSQNYALVFPDGSTYTIDWLAPSVMPLMVGAELQKQLSGDVSDSDNATGFTRGLEAIAKVGNPVLEMSMMQGVTDALQSYNSGTGQFLSDFAVSSASSYGGQFIPAPVSALARTVDDIVRSSYAPKDSQLSKEGETFLRQQANKLPGVSQSMQPSIDLWGNERKREGDTVPERLLHNMFNPGTYSSNKRTDLDIQLDELYKATGSSTVLPKAATSYIDASEQNPKVYLNSEEYTRFAKTKGQKSQKYVSDFVNSSIYGTLDNDAKADIVADLYSLANYEARKEALTGRSIVYATAMYEKALDSGVEPYEYYATKARFGGKWSDYEDAAKFSGYADRMQMTDDKFVEVYDSIGDLKADKNKNGKSISGSRQDKVEKYLNSELSAGNITKEQWWYFWTKEYSSKAKNAPYDWIREANK